MTINAYKFLTTLDNLSHELGYFLYAKDGIELIQLDQAKEPVTGSYDWDDKPEQDAEVTNIRFVFDNNIVKNSNVKNSKYYSPVTFKLEFNDLTYLGKSYLDASMLFVIPLADVIDSVNYLLEENTMNVVRVSVVINKKVYKFSLVQ